MVEAISRRHGNILLGYPAREDAEASLPGIDEMYHHYHKSVYNFIAFRINNHHDAEELASDVFVKAMQNLGKYNPAFPIEAWLITIAKNTANDYLRKTMRRQFLPLEKIWGMASTKRQPEEIAVINEDCRELMVAMSKLSNKERQIVSMKFATELKHSEIAAIMGISESHVGVTAHRAVTKLRKFMEVPNEK